MLPTKRKHISFSELREHFHCPHAHWLVHIKKVGVPEINHHMEFGSAMHNACEHYVKTREIDLEAVEKDIRDRWKKYKFPDVMDLDVGITSEMLKKIKDLSGAKEFLAEFDETLKDVDAGEMGLQTATKKIKKAWKDNGLPILENYILGAHKILEELPIFLDLTFPGWEPVTTEDKLYEKLPFREEDLSFKGYIDVVIKTEKDGQAIYHVLDWKTCSKPWKKWKRNEEILKYQLIYYREFWRAKNKKKPDQVKCGFVTLAHDPDLKTARCELIKVEPTKKRRQGALSVLNEMIDVVQSGKHNKRKRNKWGSNCKFCPFLETEYCR